MVVGDDFIFAVDPSFAFCITCESLPFLLICLLPLALPALAKGIMGKRGGGGKSAFSIVPGEGTVSLKTVPVNV